MDPGDEQECGDWDGCACRKTETRVVVGRRASRLIFSDAGLPLAGVRDVVQEALAPKISSWKIPKSSGEPVEVPRQLSRWLPKLLVYFACGVGSLSRAEACDNVRLAVVSWVCATGIAKSP